MSQSRFRCGGKDHDSPFGVWARSTRRGLRLAPAGAPDAPIEHAHRHSEPVSLEPSNELVERRASRSEAIHRAELPLLVSEPVAWSAHVLSDAPLDLVVVAGKVLGHVEPIDPHHERDALHRLAAFPQLTRA